MELKASHYAFIVLAGFMLVLLGLIFFLKPVPVPERFTELYFQNPSSLPEQIIAHQSTSFSFVIHNEEGMIIVYPYVISFQSVTGSSMVFSTGTVSLADGESAVVAISHTFAQSAAQGLITVNLPSLNQQQIDFHLSHTE